MNEERQTTSRVSAWEWWIRASLASALSITTVLVGDAQAQQVPIPQTPGQVPGPVSGTALTKEYIQMIGRMAYLWGWPLVNVANRADSFSKAPEPGLLGGVVPVAFNRNAMLTGYVSPDQHFVTCPNQDVVYGAGFFWRNPLFVNKGRLFLSRDVSQAKLPFVSLSSSGLRHLRALDLD